MYSKAVLKNVYRNTFSTMGTRCQMLLPGLDDEHGEQVFKLIQKDVLRLENDISHFKDDSEISQINRAAARRPVPVSEEVFELLQTCRKYHDLTDGMFDITHRLLHEFWNNPPDEYSQGDEIEKILNIADMKYITLNERNHTVSFERKGIKIDMSGIGKGFTLEKIKKLLRSYSVKNAFVSLGESTILALGCHPEGDHWKVGMKDYLNPENILHTFRVRDGAVSTSSSFFADDQGRLQSRRMIDLDTGYPVNKLNSASVCSGSAVLVEVLANVFLVSSEKRITSISEKMGRFDSIKANYDSEQVEVKRFCKQEVHNKK